MLQTIICGAGQVGFHIAKQLASEGNDVCVIDHNAELIAKTTELLDVRGIVGHAAHPDVLETADAKNADLLIAATFADEINMVACHLAHALFQVPMRIARIRNQSYLKPEYQDAFLGRNMPIDVIISPELEIAHVILQRLRLPTAFDSAPFFDDRLRIIGTRVSKETLGANTPFRQLETLFPNTKMHIFAYVRDGKLSSANLDDQFFPGDEVYFAAEEAQVPRALEIFGQASEGIGKSVTIVGGGNIGMRVALELEAAGGRPKLIEKNRAQAERAAEALERTIVFHGDALSADIMAESGIHDAAAMIAVSDDDKINVLSCSLAKAMGCRRTLALTNDSSFAPLVDQLEIDAFFNPRTVTVSTILRHIRHGSIRMVHSVRDGEGEVLEVNAFATAKVVGMRIKDLETASSMRVCAVLSAGKIILPSPEIVIQDQDVLTVFVLKRDLPVLYQLFRVSPLF